MIIRKASIADIPQIVKGGEAFYEYAGFHKKGISCDPNRFADFLHNLIGNPTSIILVADDDGDLVGAIAGVVHPWMLDLSQNIATELWWWVFPGHRDKRIGEKLLREFEKTGKEYGASLSIMVTLDTNNENKLISFYEKFGYKYLESHYIKEL